MLLTALFQTKILDNLFLGNFEFDFVLHVSWISWYLCYVLYGLTFIIDLTKTFSLTFSKMSSIQNLLSLFLALKAFLTDKIILCVFLDNLEAPNLKKLSCFLGPTIREPVGDVYYFQRPPNLKCLAPPLILLWVLSWILVWAVFCFCKCKSEVRSEIFFENVTGPLKN